MKKVFLIAILFISTISINAQTKYINNGTISYPEGTQTEMINDEFHIKLPVEYVFLAKPINTDDVISIAYIKTTCACISASGTCTSNSKGTCVASGCTICKASIFNPNGGGQIDVFAIMNRKDGSITKISTK
jgi:hypothetical protein